MYNKNKGFVYEEIAKRYLINNNFKIIEENFTSKFGEIDIIAKKNSIICFIEVKGRKNTEHQMPREDVTKFKQKKIISTANYFILKKGYDDIQFRFDVIEIIYDEKTINYIEDAFWV